MKRILILFGLLCIVVSVAAQGRLGGQRGGGGGFTPVEPIEYRPQYPASIPNYMPSASYKDPKVHIFKASGWRLLPRPGFHKLPEGYLVYKKDTIEGYIYIDRNDVYIEQPVDSGKSFYYAYKMSNSGLKCVVIYNRQNKLMTLVRLNENDNRLWRVVHEGKVSVYDERVGFIYAPEDINKDAITIIYNGEQERMTTFFGFDVKQTLLDYINSGYGYKLKPQNYTWHQALEFIDNLD